MRVVEEIRPFYLLFGTLIGVGALAFLGLSTTLDSAGGEMCTEKVSEVPTDYSDQVDEPERVILVYPDTLRADRLGTYGYERDTSPFIDEFAEDSVVFENAIAPAPWTKPVTASLFTSTYPTTHGSYDGRKPLDEELYTLAEVMNQDGFETGGFHGGGFVDSDFNFDRGFDTYSSFETARNLNFNQTFPRSVDFLSSHQDQSFVFVQGYEPHFPYYPPAPYTEMFADPDYDNDRVDDYLLQTNRGAITLNEEVVKHGEGNITVHATDERGEFQLEDRDIERIRDHYDGGVRHFDSLFEEFIEDLKEEGMYEDSVIILTSDHGENLVNSAVSRGSQEGYWVTGHRWVWDHTVHVPLIIHAPGMEGQRISQPVSSVDIKPTILDIVGNEPEKDVRQQICGQSLLLTIFNEETDRYVYTESPTDDTAVIRGEEWKYINGSQNVELLYNLEEDTNEEDNLIEEEPEIHQELSNKLQDKVEIIPEGMEGISREEADISEETQERLEDLGYVD